MSYREYVDHWGTTPAEREMVFPCDLFLPDAQACFYRGIDIQAEPALVHRWLCQLKAAPYSYDLIDNLGRRSPPYLIEGLEELEIGQRFMFIFRLVDFDDRQITLRTRGLFGELLVSYLVTDEPVRLLAKLVVNYSSGPIGWLTRLFLPWGDWFMMRKQFLTFKALCERSISRS